MSNHELDRAPEAVARQVAAKDPQFAELLEAQCRRLRDDTPDNRLRERELAQQSGPHRPRYRSQFWLPRPGLFDDNLTRLDDGDRAYVWLCDDDIVTLGDAHPDGNDPWAHNTDARARLVELWGTRSALPVSSIRLCLFGGTAPMAQTAIELGAASHVTHLELRTQNEDARHGALAGTFPALRGLACGGSEVEPLLTDGAEELRALIVRRATSLPAVLDHALRSPRLRHLGLFHAPTTEADLEAFSRHALLPRLTSIEFFSLNDATRFPFDALLARREAFASLSRVMLAGHLVPDEVRRRFDDWPELELVSFDRRETMAFDFETFGWAAGAR